MGSESLNRDEIKKVELRLLQKGILKPAMLVGMITCISFAMVNLVKAFNPSWQGLSFLAGMVFVTIESLYSHRVLLTRGRIRDNNFHYRMVEWGIIVLFLKAFTYVNKPWRVTSADIQSWAGDPLNIFTTEFVIITVLSIIIWSATTNTMKVFDSLFDREIVRRKDLDPFSSLTNRFYFGGILLIFISGISQWIYSSEAGTVTLLNRQSADEFFLEILIYFILGLILISETQLNIHFAGWQSQKIQVSANVRKSWMLYGISFLIIISLVVFFLPTSYTSGFLSSAKLMLKYGIKIILSLAQILWVIMLFPLKWLLSLFPLDNVPFKKEMSDRLEFTGEYEIDAPDSDVAYSFIFWLVLFAVVLYLLTSYLKDHPGLLNWIKNLRLRYAWLIRLLRWITGNVQSMIELIPQPIIFRINKIDKTTRTKKRRFRFGKLSPRQRILYYYLSTLQRAEKSGYKRQKSQTPEEFALQLDKAIPNIHGEMALLTESFVCARYSKHIFKSNDAFLLKKIWKTILYELRQKNKSSAYVS